MRSRIINWSLALVAVLLLPQVSKAQIAASNPLEWIALAEGNELINGQIEKQIKGQTQTALLQNSIAAEFNRIHEWQKQYNGYLKTVNGYASSLKACTHLYNDGVRIFLKLFDDRSAVFFLNCSIDGHLLLSCLLEGLIYHFHDGGYFRNKPCEDHQLLSCA